MKYNNVEMKYVFQTHLGISNFIKNNNNNNIFGVRLIEVSFSICISFRYAAAAH